MMPSQNSFYEAIFQKSHLFINSPFSSSISRKYLKFYLINRLLITTSSFSSTRKHPHTTRPTISPKTPPTFFRPLREAGERTHLPLPAGGKGGRFGGGGCPVHCVYHCGCGGWVMVGDGLDQPLFLWCPCRLAIPSLAQCVHPCSHIHSFRCPSFLFIPFVFSGRVRIFHVLFLTLDFEVHVSWCFTHFEIMNDSYIGLSRLLFIFTVLYLSCFKF